MSKDIIFINLKKTKRQNKIEVIDLCDSSDSESSSSEDDEFLLKNPFMLQQPVIFESGAKGFDKIDEKSFDVCMDNDTMANFGASDFNSANFDKSDKLLSTHTEKKSNGLCSSHHNSNRSLINTAPIQVLKQGSRQCHPKDVQTFSIGQLNSIEAYSEEGYHQAAAEVIFSFTSVECQPPLSCRLYLLDLLATSHSLPCSAQAFHTLSTIQYHHPLTSYDLKLTPEPLNFWELISSTVAASLRPSYGHTLLLYHLVLILEDDLHLSPAVAKSIVATVSSHTKQLVCWVFDSVKLDSSISASSPQAGGDCCHWQPLLTPLLQKLLDLSLATSLSAEEGALSATNYALPHFLRLGLEEKERLLGSIGHPFLQLKLVEAVLAECFPHPPTLTIAHHLVNAPLSVGRLLLIDFLREPPCDTEEITQEFLMCLFYLLKGYLNSTLTLSVEDKQNLLNLDQHGKSLEKRFKNINRKSKNFLSAILSFYYLA